MSEILYKNELVVKLIEDETGAEDEPDVRKVIVTTEALNLKDGPFCWVKDPETPIEFNFNGLQFSNEDFRIIDISADRICIEENSDDARYSFAIFVEEVETGQVYSTTYPVTIVFYDITGRPVIRPKLY